MSKLKSENEQSSEAEIIPAAFARLLAKTGSVKKAVMCLIRNLDAKKSHFDAGKGEWILEDDGPTQVASGKALLSYAIGEPVKRQQILSGKMPDAPPDRSQLRGSIDRRIAGLLENPNLSISELLAARKSLAEQDKAEPPPMLTEEQAIAEARRIHGMNMDEVDLATLRPAAPQNSGI